MKMLRLVRRGFAVLALLALGASAATSVSAQTKPYTINVILPLTGPGASLGKDEQTALTALEKFVNTTGGIKGTPVHFDVVDDQTQPSVAVQLLQQILSTHPVVVLGSA